MRCFIRKQAKSEKDYKVPIKRDNSNESTAGLQLAGVNTGFLETSGNQ